MSEGPIRRGDLVSASGVGAMTITRSGTSVIVAGLDHWFKEGESFCAENSENEFCIRDLRLEMRLGVSHFRLPPSKDGGRRIPVLRFPEWHFCPFCRMLMQSSTLGTGRVQCPECSPAGTALRRRSYMEQVPIVAVCSKGHLQDFPWREWVHRSASVRCTKKMRLTKSGGFGLAAQRITCECGENRSLQGVLGGADESDSNLSKALTAPALSSDRTGSPEKFLCQGKKPWLGSFGRGEHCTEPLRASLRTSSNIYFPNTPSSLYLPEQQSARQFFSELVATWNAVGASTVAEIASAIGADPVEALRAQYGAELNEITDLDLRRALAFAGNLQDNDPIDFWRQSMRGKEFTTLSSCTMYPSKSVRDDDDTPSFLVIDPTDLDEYGIHLRTRFARVNLVPKLRETRVLSGFSRVTSGGTAPRDEQKRLMWAKTVKDWLPAYVALGEGFFVQFDSAAIEEWKQSQKSAIAQRLAVLLRNGAFAKTRQSVDVKNAAQFVMMHTFAHIVMNRLVYECGYQTAALRERLYCSPDGKELGVLIYTAAGDSDGTMGGLVRMGMADRLPLVIQRALEGAQWCSSDPVCRDVGGRNGQGPSSCNLAACHSCAMVPETACEEFNRLLDRGLLVGNPDEPNLGFFPNNIL